MRRHHWHDHPGVRSEPHELSLGERAADALRNGMGSWAFTFGALTFLAVWMGLNRRHGFDPFPFILLNLVLSCLAALQGAILLIAAKRQDQISSELAQHDYQTNVEAKQILETMAAQHTDLHRQVATLTDQLRQLGVLPAAPATAPAQTGPGQDRPGETDIGGQVAP